MKIYTRTGDHGETGLYSGRRVSKDHPRIAAIGDVDELNCALGYALGLGLAPSLAECLEIVQDDLFHLGAELASVDPIAAGTARLNKQDIARLEAWIDHFEAELEPLRHFILPGGGPAGGAIHLARAVARRAERGVVALAAADGRPGENGVVPVIYLNRLSDLLFVAARWQNRHDRRPERAWRPTDRDARPPVLPPSTKSL